MVSDCQSLCPRPPRIPPYPHTPTLAKTLAPEQVWPRDFDASKVHLVPGNHDVNSEAPDVGPSAALACRWLAAACLCYPFALGCRLQLLRPLPRNPCGRAVKVLLLLLLLLLPLPLPLPLAAASPAPALPLPLL